MGRLISFFGGGGGLKKIEIPNPPTVFLNPVPNVHLYFGRNILAITEPGGNVAVLGKSDNPK